VYSVAIISNVDLNLKGKKNILPSFAIIGDAVRADKSVDPLNKT